MKETENIKRYFFSDVEKLFTEYVEYYGGTIVDKLNNNKTDRPNADFLFDEPQIVAELKILQKDIFSGPEDFPRLSELIETWMTKGLLTRKALNEHIFKGAKLPKKCMQDLIDRASKTIERAIYKANKQIEETKRTLNRGNANGIIFLINDGNYFFSPQSILAVICKLIDRKFRNSYFDVIIYLTVNQVTSKEDSELDYNIWIPIYTKIDQLGDTIASNELVSFVNTFGEKFLTDFLTLKSGHNPTEFRQIECFKESIEEIKKHEFIPKEIIFKK